MALRLLTFADACAVDREALGAALTGAIGDGVGHRAARLRRGARPARPGPGARAAGGVRAARPRRPAARVPHRGRRRPCRPGRRRSAGRPAGWCWRRPSTPACPTSPPGPRPTWPRCATSTGRRRRRLDAFVEVLLAVRARRAGVDSCSGSTARSCWRRGSGRPRSGRTSPPRCTRCRSCRPSRCRRWRWTGTGAATSTPTSSPTHRCRSWPGCGSTRCRTCCATTTAAPRACPPSYRATIGRINLAEDCEINDDLVARRAPAARRTTSARPPSACPTGKLFEEYLPSIPPSVACPLCGSGAHGGIEPWDIGPAGTRVSPTEAEAIRRYTADAVRAAAAQPGRRPGRLAPVGRRVLEPTVDWRQVLAGSVRQAIGWASRRGRLHLPAPLPPRRRPAPGGAAEPAPSDSRRSRSSWTRRGPCPMSTSPPRWRRWRECCAGSASGATGSP